LVGFEGGELGEERNALADYGKRRVEAELGVDVDFIMPGSGDEMQSLFLSGENGYDLVLSLGQSSSLDMLFARPADVQVQAAALDFEISQPVPGEDAVSLIRYRVEEGSYICGFLAGWLTSRGGHPLTNTLPLAAFIGALDDPLEPYYDGGFSKGVKTAAPTGGTHRYFIKTGGDSAQARAYAEDAIKKGVDIIFCTPGTFNGEVIKVAEEKNVLVILVGADRSGESPKHVLTSLILRDDNAVFNAVSKALSGDLKPGKQVWGIGEGTWSLAPFHEHDNYIRKDLKEALRQEEEKVSGIDFSS
jgi:basic membrane protein A